MPVGGDDPRLTAREADRVAFDSNDIAMRSPAVSSMSSSRRSGLADTCLASASRSSVVPPIAETTTTTPCPAARVRITRAATRRMRATSATLEPPYFWTTMDIGYSKSFITKSRRTRRPRSNQFRTNVVFVAFVFSESS
jgi:hypothetical protein